VGPPSPTRKKKVFFWGRGGGGAGVLRPSTARGGGKDRHICPSVLRENGKKGKSGLPAVTARRKEKEEGGAID